MKTIIYKNENYNRIEFWAATTIFVFAVFFRITDALGNNWATTNRPAAESTPFDYYFVATLIRYIMLYGVFLLLNFIIVPSLLQRALLFKNIVFIVLLFLLVGSVFGITDTYLKYNLFQVATPGYVDYNFIFQKSFLYTSWLLLMFGFYSVIKYTGLYLLSNLEAIQTKYRFIAPGALAAFVLWMICMFILLAGNADRGIKAIWAIVVPCAILFYSYSFHYLIPASVNKKKPFRSYLGKTFLVLVLSFLPVFLTGAVLTNDPEGGAAISSFNIAFQLVITMPLTWVLYKRYIRGNEEIFALKKELGQSNASFDFLRSQINPHFLFNALNTIYGTAIQEKAERTGEGIEKLGDMMRFMLQENMQDKISLAREIEYVNNYIGLQKLRTDPNPNIHVEVAIEQQINTIPIAPMLLIPFVENAFKHGISFREPSYISITLETRDGVLYFDVSNSKHVKQENDPEKYKSGIGLSNVKQRLQLLYPGKHELFIRETKKDFFIHLTLQLT